MSASDDVGTDARGSRSVTRGFLFADLRGYTAYVDRRGATSAADLLDRFRALVRSAVEQHDGAEVRTEGDSFYVVFPSASSAVACALAIVRRANEPSGVDEPIPVGVGVHAGEAIDTPEGPVGSAVNIAARLAAMAGPREVLVSDTVRSLTRSVGRATFVPVGRRRIKGLDDSMAIYRAVAPATAVTTSSNRPRAVLALVAGLTTAAIVAGVVVVASLVRTPTPSPSLSIPTSSAANRTFATRNFAVPFELELGSSWVLAGDEADLVSFSHGAAPRGWIDVLLVAAVLDPPCDETEPEFIGERPADVIDWLATRPWLESSSPRPYNVRSHLGRSVDIRVPEGPEWSCPTRVSEPTLFQLGASSFPVDFGERKRVIAIDVAGRAVTISLGSPFADVEEFWELAESRLHTIQFTED